MNERNVRNEINGVKNIIRHHKFQAENMEDLRIVISISGSNITIYGCPYIVLYNLLVLEGLINVSEVLDASMFIHSEVLDTKTFDKYISNIADKLVNNNHNIPINVAEDSVGNVINATTEYIDFLGSFITFNTNLYSIMDMVENNIDVKDIIENDHFMNQTDYLEIHKTRDELYDKIKNIRMEPMYTLGKTGAIRDEQAKNMIIGIGERPDVYDTSALYPKQITDKWIMGIKNTDTYNEEAGIARRALVISKTTIKEAGIVNKRTAITFSSVKMRTDDHMCNTREFIPKHITDQAILDDIDNRYAYMVKHPNDLVNDMFIIKKENTELIGTTVYLRSPITCNSVEGICKYCFSDAYHKFSSDNDRSSKVIGGMAAKMTISKAAQFILQAKHNTKPTPKVIELLVNDTVTDIYGEFSEWFDINFANIKLKDGKKVKQIAINIPISKSNRLTIYDAPGFSILTYDDKILNFNFINSSIIFDVPIQYNKIDNLQNIDITEIMKNGGAKLKLPNYALTQLFYDLSDLLKLNSSVTHNGKISNMKELFDTIDSILYPTNHSLIREIIISILIMDKHNTYKKPDFSKMTLDDVKLVTLDVLRSKFPSFIPPLSLGFFKEKFTNGRYFFKDTVISSQYDVLVKDKDRKSKDINIDLLSDDLDNFDIIQ